MIIVECNHGAIWVTNIPHGNVDDVMKGGRISNRSGQEGMYKVLHAAYMNHNTSPEHA